MLRVPPMITNGGDGEECVLEHPRGCIYTDSVLNPKNLKKNKNTFNQMLVPNSHIFFRNCLIKYLEF